MNTGRASVHTAVRRATVVAAALSFVPLATLGGEAPAQKADHPAVKVGDQWKFAQTRDGKPVGREFVWTISTVTPEGIAGTENGEPLQLTAELNVRDSPRRKDSNRRLLNFPLEVGKAWTYEDGYVRRDTGTQGMAKGSVVVLSFEKVRVLAGEFDAYKLESKADFNGTSISGAPVSGTVYGTHWYAPAARAIVKEAMKDPYRGAEGFELAELKLMP